MTAKAASREADLAALEASMGVMAVGDGEHWDGEIPEEDDDDDGGPRGPVVYSQDALFDDDMPAPPTPVNSHDALFDDDDDMPAPPAPPSTAAASGSDLGGGLEAAGLAQLLGGGGGAGGGGSTQALISHLEQMADDLEAQSGEEETEIRGKIALLRSVLEMQSAAVRKQLGQIAALDGQVSSGGAESEQAVQALGGLQAMASESAQRIEQGMGAVETMLREDDDARRLLAETSSVWMPAIASTSGAAEEPAAAAVDEEFNHLGFKGDYDYEQHMKPMGMEGGKFVAAPSAGEAAAKAELDDDVMVLLMGDGPEEGDGDGDEAMLMPDDFVVEALQGGQPAQ